MNQTNEIAIFQTQKLITTPLILQSLKILQYSSLELDGFVKEEALKNPLLDYEPPKGIFTGSDKLYNQAKFEGYTYREGTLVDNILEQIIISKFSPTENAIAVYLTNALDENGYLTVSTGEAAKVLGVMESEVEKVLTVLQDFEPIGVFARDLKECLVLQLKDKGVYRDVIKDIVDNHIDDIAKNGISRIAKETGLEEHQVQNVVDYIRTLDPKPGKSFNSKDNLKFIVPDVYLNSSDGKTELSINEDSFPDLKINSYYENLRLDESNDKETRKYLNERYNSATWIIHSVNKRRDTIYKVANAIVNHQKEFFEKGYDYLKPLTLKDISKELELAESTVSRASKDKYIQTENGVFELRFFFSSGVSKNDGKQISSNSIKKMIANLIKDEDKLRPISDDKITQALKEKGIEISRRTVAKYRESMGIKSSQGRKRF